MDNQHFTISKNSSIQEALVKINAPYQGKYLILFVEDEDERIVGVLSDGDIRRSIANTGKLEARVADVMNTNFTSFRVGEVHKRHYAELREKGVYVIPLLDDDSRLIRIVDLRKTLAMLPLEAVIMAGGKGMRLRPLTENTPKPLLKVGDKAVMEWNVERIFRYGLSKIHVSVNYLGHQIVDYFSAKAYGNQMSFVTEDEPMGTLGSVNLMKEQFQTESILLMNSDLISNIDLEAFYDEFESNKADLAMVSIPYKVNVPYAVLETSGKVISSFKEKPTYTYYSNGGIYLIRKTALSLMPETGHYDATQLFEDAIQSGMKVIHFAHPGYWLDVGKHEDFEKAQVDIKRLNLLG